MTTDLFAGERHLLVILPHPDDESFGVAGVMAMLRQRGVPVTYVCATGGQMGRHMGRPPFANRETLAALRRRELAEAMGILNVADWRMLGLWDKTVEFEDRDRLAQRLLAIIREVNPSTLITFHPQYGGHPDHKALGAAVIQAVEQLPAGERPRVWCPVVSREHLQLGIPVVEVDITPYQEKKMAAFRAHRSQTSDWEERLAKNERMREEFKELFVKERFLVHPVSGGDSPGQSPQDGAGEPGAAGR